MIAAGQDGGRACAFEIVASVEGLDGGVGFGGVMRMVADENYLGEAVQGVGEFAGLTCVFVQTPPPESL